MPKKIDLTNLRFGRWFVKAKADSVNTQVRWLCVCDCGKERLVYGSFLRKGISTSCGCYRAEQVKKAKTKHGHAKQHDRDRTYRSWESMIRRASSKKYKGYKDYAGRGITVNPRWLQYENFLADMGPRPEHTSLDRIDVNGNYEPQNCRWADAVTQRANRRDSLAKI